MINMSTVFPVDTLHTCLPPASTYLVSPPHKDSILRFFDTSPFSPSNNYVAYAQFNRTFEETAKSGNDHWSSITITSLHSGKSEVVASTQAWESQVGPHLQWGAEDSSLFYNTFVDRSSSFPFEHEDVMLRGHGKYAARAVHYNPITKTSRYLDCPVYHISHNGKWSVAPNLYRIGYTQGGYGIKSKNGGLMLPANDKASNTDGIYVTDVENGKCKLLVSLKRLATIAGLDTESTPTYGFHSKWSSDGKDILFIMRTMENRHASSVVNGLYSVVGKETTVRIQHMFLVPRTGEGIKYILSWGSAPSIFLKSGKEIRLMNGNHPNWVPNSRYVSINMENNAGVEVQDGAVSAGGGADRAPRKAWNIVATDLDRVPEGNTIHDYSNFVTKCQATGDCTLWKATSLSGLLQNAASAPTLKTWEMPMFAVNHLGSGHPNAAAGGRFVFTDAYVKERAQFSLMQPDDKSQAQELKLKKYSVPLRLIDTESQKEAWVVQIPISDRSYELSNGPETVNNVWRCDPHPAWSRDFKWVAYNGRPDGVHRQLYISHLGDDLENVFNNCPQQTMQWK